jgi:hypothetical protein
MKYTSTGHEINSFTAKEAKPLVREWLDDLLRDNGYTVKKTSIYKTYADFKVTWRINAPAEVNFDTDKILEGVRIFFVNELWMTEICKTLRLTELPSQEFDENRRFFLARYDVEHEMGTRNFIPWDMYSPADIEKHRPAMGRAAIGIIDMFDRMVDSIDFFNKAFGISDLGPRPMDDSNTRLIALYRLALVEGANSDRFKTGIEKWHKKKLEFLAGIELKQCSPPNLLLQGMTPEPPPNINKMRKWGMSEDMIKQRLDPLYAFDVALEEDNHKFRNLARALGQPENIWVMKNPRKGK